MRYEPGQSFALLPCTADAGVWIAEPSQGRVQKFVGRRSVPAGALPIERPAKHQFCGTVMFGRQVPEPLVNQRGFADTLPGHDGHDIDLRVSPGRIQKSQVLLSTKDLACSNGQSSYGY